MNSNYQYNINLHNFVKAHNNLPFNQLFDYIKYYVNGCKNITEPELKDFIEYNNYTFSDKEEKVTLPVRYKSYILTNYCGDKTLLEIKNKLEEEFKETVDENLLYEFLNTNNINYVRQTKFNSQQTNNLPNKSQLIKSFVNSINANNYTLQEIHSMLQEKYPAVEFKYKYLRTLFYKYNLPYKRMTIQEKNNRRVASRLKNKSLYNKNTSKRSVIYNELKKLSNKTKDMTFAEMLQHMITNYPNRDWTIYDIRSAVYYYNIPYKHTQYNNVNKLNKKPNTNVRRCNKIIKPEIVEYVLSLNTENLTFVQLRNLVMEKFNLDSLRRSTFSNFLTSHNIKYKKLNYKDNKTTDILNYLKLINTASLCVKQITTLLQTNLPQYEPFTVHNVTYYLKNYNIPYKKLTKDEKLYILKHKKQKVYNNTEDININSNVENLSEENKVQPKNNIVTLNNLVEANIKELDKQNEAKEYVRQILNKAFKENNCELELNYKIKDYINCIKLLKFITENYTDIVNKRYKQYGICNEYQQDLLHEIEFGNEQQKEFAYYKLEALRPIRRYFTQDKLQVEQFKQFIDNINSKRLDKLYSSLLLIEEKQNTAKYEPNIDKSMLTKYNWCEPHTSQLENEDKVSDDLQLHKYVGTCEISGGGYGIFKKFTKEFVSTTMEDAEKSFDLIINEIKTKRKDLHITNIKVMLVR